MCVNVFILSQLQDLILKSALVSLFICVDATYMLLELRFPVYVMLVEDGNGQSEITAIFLLLEENEASLSSMVSAFKKHNSRWESSCFDGRQRYEREMYLLLLFPKQSCSSTSTILSDHLEGKLSWIKWVLHQDSAICA